MVAGKRGYKIALERGRMRAVRTSDGGRRAADLVRAQALDIDRDGKPIPGHNLHYEQWLAQHFPEDSKCELADFHHEYWRWIQDLKPEVAPATSFVGCWFRGAGKTTTTELGVVYATVNCTRRFIVLVAETQDQADERIKNISDKLLSLGVRNAVNKFGHSLGWKADMLRTENGVAILGIGLNRAFRGLKLGRFRADLIVFDDIDGREDTPLTTKKKLRTITEKILKAGSRHLAAAFVQNLIHSESIMAQVVKGKADFLLDRNQVVPIPACRDLVVRQESKPDGGYRWKVVSGKPSWSGFSLEDMEREINRGGWLAFDRESQQNVEEEGDGLWSREDIRYWSEDALKALGDGIELQPEGPTVDDDGIDLPLQNLGVRLPVFTRIVVAVDPSGSKSGDEVGIVAAGLFLRRWTDSDGKPRVTRFGMALEDLSDHLSAQQWTQVSAELHQKLDADELVAERNFGGDLVEMAFKTIPGAPSVTLVVVSKAKLIRAEPIQRLAENGQIFHAKRLPGAERQLTTWHPSSGMKSPGALDAYVIAFSRLFGISDFIRDKKTTKPVGRVIR